MKPGIKTTEFWLTLLGQIITLVLAAMGKITPELASGLVVGGSAVYGTQRVAAKRAADSASAAA
jgi:hypothetical protein